MINVDKRIIEICKDKAVIENVSPEGYAIIKNKIEKLIDLVYDLADENEEFWQRISYLEDEVSGLKDRNKQLNDMCDFKNIKREILDAYTCGYETGQRTVKLVKGDKP